METIYWILATSVYVLGGGFTFNYVASAIGDANDPFNTPGPLLTSLVWPLAIIYIMGRPICKLGSSLAQWQIDRQEAQELQSKKMRVELLRAQEELEEIEQELEQEFKMKRVS